MICSQNLKILRITCLKTLKTKKLPKNQNFKKFEYFLIGIKMEKQENQQLLQLENIKKGIFKNIIQQVPLGNLIAVRGVLKSSHTTPVLPPKDRMGANPQAPPLAKHGVN